MSWGEISASGPLPCWGCLGSSDISVLDAAGSCWQNASGPGKRSAKLPVPTRVFRCWTHTTATQSKVQNPHELLLTHRLPFPSFHPQSHSRPRISATQASHRDLEGAVTWARELEPPVVSRLLSWEITNTKSSSPSKFEFVVLTFNSLL